MHVKLDWCNFIREIAIQGRKRSKIFFRFGKYSGTKLSTRLGGNTWQGNSGSGNPSWQGNPWLQNLQQQQQAAQRRKWIEMQAEAGTPG